MSKPPVITGIEVHEFQFEVKNLSHSPENGSLTYTPGKHGKLTHNALRILTDQGIVGEYVNSRIADAMVIRLFAGSLIGKNALEREKIYHDVKTVTRQYGRLGMGIVDIALWDIAGKYHNAPICQLLGGYRKRLPTYASTFHGDNVKGGLDSPEAYADFAERCLEMGYPAFKLHTWIEVDTEREIAAVEAVARRVGSKMDLMLDPGCSYDTFADTLKIGRALDEAGYYWYEDPMKDGGISAFGHRKLRQLIKTPLLQCEYLRMLEPHVDFTIADGTDLLRGDPDFDGGITGVMKIAHAAEGLGLDVELHAAGPARRHCMAAIRNSNYYEMALVHPDGGPWNAPAYKDGYRDGLDAIGKDGCVPVPEGPGLGVQYDWDYIKKNTTNVATYG